MNQQFVENLISLRSHYQSVHEEIERDKARAREQLTHVNALLLDQLGEEQQFVENLIELRKHYQRVVDECDRKASQVGGQLIQVNALLADQLVLHHNQPVPMQALTVNENENPALTSATDIGSEKFPKEIKKPDEPDAVDEAEENEAVDESDSLTPTAGVVQSEQSPIPSPSVSDNGQAVTSPFPPLKTPMLPKYQQMTKLQAVESLLLENADSILHIDYIVRALHGELEPDAMRAEKSRMTQTLSEGAKKGLWHKVPQQPGCYTINLKRVEPELDSQEISQQSKADFRQRRLFRGKPENKMLPRYQGLNLTDAVEAVVSENAGQILNTDFVARALYGELSGQALTKAKDKIGKTLWSGAKQERWQRVPGQLGAYTLDMKLVART